MISVENLFYTYPGNDQPTVKGISFSVPDGQIFGFLGPSGAGKSTTQKVMIGLLRGFEGKISIMGKGLREWGDSYYNRIGVGFELPNHYLKLTAQENLQFFGSFFDHSSDTTALLDMVGLLPDKDRKVQDFSKGMKVRLNFIRALLNDPEVLFLDEPTTGLDPVNSKIIKDIILEQRDLGKTIFLTTHNMYDADEVCNEVAFIVDGKLSLIGQPNDLKIEHGKRKLLLKYSDGVPGETESKEFSLDGLGDNGQFLELIKDKEIISIHSEDATLNDVFIKVTGRSL